MRPRWQSAKRPDTAIGAFCMGVHAFRRGGTVIPTRLNHKDTKAWVLGWNQEAERQGDPRRHAIPNVKKRAPRKMKTPSHDTEAAVLREAMNIAKVRGWYVERRNTGAFQTETSFFRFGSLGAADLIIVIPVIKGLGIHIEAEAKRRDGKGRQSESQVAFQKEMKERGIPYFIFTSGEEFECNINQIRLDIATRFC